VSRATAIICDTIAGLPWQVFRGWEQLPNPNWIDDPQNLARDGRLPTEQGPEIFEVRLSAVEFWTQWIVSALWFGDGYIYVPSRDAAGLPQPPLFILNPSEVTIDYEAPYSQYSVGDYVLSPPEIIHLRGEPPYEEGHGQGVFTRNGLDLALAMTVRQYAGGQYASGIPYGYLKSGQPRMDEDQAGKLRDRWMAQHGRTKRSIAVLNATTEFVPLTITPLDAQLSDARTWSLRDIALAFGIPPYMLGVSGDTSTYANVEGRYREFTTLTLLPWLRRIESTLDAQFPRGTELHIKTAGLERADTATRYNTYKIALESGIMTRDEVRALENLPPLGNEADPNIPDTAPTGGVSNGVPAADASSLNASAAN
jgi:HK97 family phage portal protein